MIGCLAVRQTLASSATLPNQPLGVSPRFLALSARQEPRPPGLVTDDRKCPPNSGEFDYSPNQPLGVSRR